MRYVLLHFHIFKNAGTTIEDGLAHSFGEYARIDTDNRDAILANDELLAYLRAHPDVRALSSHQIRYPVPCEPGFLLFDLLFLRDPLDRVRSMYDYFRAKPSPGDPVSDWAASLDLGDYVERLVDEAPWYVNDAQVNTIANGVCNDPPTEADLEVATRRIRQSSFLGVVDRFNESVELGQRRLRPVFPTLRLIQPTANASADSSEPLATRVQRFSASCKPAVWKRLVALNRLDTTLLESARAELNRRRAELR